MASILWWISRMAWYCIFMATSRSIKGWAKYAKDFTRYNYDVVLVDYRGFGKVQVSVRKKNDAE